MAKILLLNGPSLNLLGQREPAVYGKSSLNEICLGLIAHAEELGHELRCQQSNHEGELVDWIHQAANNSTDFVLINPGAYGHTSIAIRDALLGVNLPFIEIHLSNIYHRESFRHHSYLSDIAKGVICGLGATGYGLALTAAHKILTKQM